MARVLVLSSQVAHGYVGLSAMVPALQALGHEVTALPTILLSSRPGYAHLAGERIDPDVLRRMIDALGANGWLSEIDAVVTGYLPTAEHVAVADEAIERVQSVSESALIFVDPVLGDDPKGLYIDAAAAIAVRDRLVPVADIVTPNRFELAWLTGCEVTDQASARVAAGKLDVPVVAATSIPEGQYALVTLLCHEDRAHACSVRRRRGVPNGTGDLFTALFAGHCLLDSSFEEALGAATAAVQALISASQGEDELRLVEDLAGWIDAAPLPVIEL